MAILSGNGGFTGSLANLSAFRVKGSDKIILRTKGGATKKQIKQHPNFERVRSNNAEFGSCSKMASLLRRELHPFVNLVDHNLNAAFSALHKTMQLRDTEHPPGQRCILYSQHRYLLANFALNRRYGFDSVLRYPLQANFDRELGTARMEIPALQPGIHLQFPWQQPYYRLIVHFFVMCDLTHDGRDYTYHNATQKPYCPLYVSGWLPVTATRPGEDLLLTLRESGRSETLIPVILEDTHSLFLAVGIQMGKPGPDETILETKYCGTGKIIAVG
ncbi:MAG: hypothetical protein U9R46_13030 [Bacteroidota bacterium]|nr:hypothetical protein [Bacteroidota bacterium]